MKTSTIALLCVLATSASLADFTVDFHRNYQENRAEALFAQGTNYPAARVAFDELAATARDLPEKTMWQARAAVAVGLQKDKQAEGLEMAKAIADIPYSVQAQAEILFTARDYQAIIGPFGGEDIAAWPPRRIAKRYRWPADEDARGMTLFHRGYAYYATGDGEQAAKDLDQAAELAVNNDHQVAILRALADTQSQLLKNRDKTFDVTMRLTHLRGGTPVLSSYPQAAGYLREEHRHDEALAVLHRMPDAGGSWNTVKYSALGKTLAEAGQPEAAIAAYRKAVHVKGVHARWMGPALLGLGETLAAAGRREEAAAAYNKLVTDAKFSAYKEKAREFLEKLAQPEDID